MATQSGILTTLQYLRKDPLYTIEKLYEIRSDSIKNVPRTNRKLEQVNGIRIQNMRDQTCSLDTHGFFILNLDSAMTLDQPKTVGAIYFPDISHAVKNALGASRVQIYDYEIRKRNPGFPAASSGFEFKQPAFLAHIDETPEDAKRIVKKLNPIEADHLLNNRYQVVIAWKPLHGPVRDWPLALCDARTINAATDLQGCDMIDPDQVSEQYLVHHSPAQNWYYLKDQMPNEVLVFRQTDSNGANGVPHTSFALPRTPNTNEMPRESIEVRMLVFYDGMND